MSKFWFTILLVISFLSVRAEFDFNENCKTAYQKILSLKMAEASSIINDEKNRNPANLIPLYLENYSEFLRTFIDEDKSSFKKFKENCEMRLELLEGGQSNSPYYYYTQAELYLQSAIARIKFEEYISASYDFYKAYNLYSKNVTQFPDFIPNKKGLGILHVLIGAIPSSFQWLIGILGMDGNIKQGLSELHELLDNKQAEYEYLHNESLFILTYILYQFHLNMDRVWEIMQANKSELQDNPILCFAYSVVAMKKGNNDDGIKALLSNPVNNNHYPFYILDYQLGLAKLRRLDNDACIYFEKFIKSFKGRHKIKSAYQKLAWYYLLKNNTKRYHHYMNLCLKRGDAVIGEDKIAFNAAISENIPHKILVKARLLFDGGYYERALEELEKVSQNELIRDREKVELSYRYGRIYHEWQKLEKAVPFYKETISKGRELPYYFAANAALQLGYIFEGQNLYDEARKYYKLCLSMEDHEYKYSLDQKAKVALKRIENV
ncbi:hypothetical protein JYT36_00195 [Bacteroidales bacterium AH-315-N07]|nr:hypothetical protein [Bacteroidales bacterium AH-315-N07]